MPEPEPKKPTCPECGIEIVGTPETCAKCGLDLTVFPNFVKLFKAAWKVMQAEQKELEEKERKERESKKPKSVLDSLRGKKG